MGVVSRMKSFMGNRPAYAMTIASTVTDLSLPEYTNNIALTASGAASIATIGANQRTMPGRKVTIRGAIGTANVTFTTNTNTTTKGQVDFHTGGNVVMQAHDVVTLQQNQNGAWVRYDSTLI